MSPNAGYSREIPETTMRRSKSVAGSEAKSVLTRTRPRVPKRSESRARRSANIGEPAESNSLSQRRSDSKKDGPRRRQEKTPSVPETARSRRRASRPNKIRSEGGAIRRQLRSRWQIKLERFCRKRELFSLPQLYKEKPPY